MKLRESIADVAGITTHNVQNGPLVREILTRGQRPHHVVFHHSFCEEFALDEDLFEALGLADVRTCFKHH
jgi:hypothetical protein